MIAVADINTIWRRKPFEALANLVPVLGLAPRDILLSLRMPYAKSPMTEKGGFYEYRVTMPLGWATKFPRWTAHRSWSAIGRASKECQIGVTALVVTSPHYLELARLVRSKLPTFYYCSDDYGQYESWGGCSILKDEAELVSTVSHSFFVSEALAIRAENQYGVTRDRISVSPNATDALFLESVPESMIRALLAEYQDVRRPLVGVVGGVNDRLDPHLLLSVAEQPEVGTLVFVGPVGNVEGLVWQKLRSHPRCLFVGARPHAELPLWMQAFDVAVIPYRDTPLNRSCSPMRLYDHLAAGRPIVATSHCLQVREFKSLVDVASSNEKFVQMLISRILQDERYEEIIMRREAAADCLWIKRAEAIARQIKSYQM